MTSIARPAWRNATNTRRRRYSDRLVAFEPGKFLSVAIAAISPANRILKPARLSSTEYSIASIACARIPAIAFLAALDPKCPPYVIANSDEKIALSIEKPNSLRPMPSCFGCHKREDISSLSTVVQNPYAICHLQNCGNGTSHEIEAPIFRAEVIQIPDRFFCSCGQFDSEIFIENSQSGRLRR
jgi:hypothetical protein